MFNKLKALWRVMKAGEEVANPEFWKGVQSKGQPILATLLVSIVSLLKGTKYEIPLDDTTAMFIAGGVFAGVNWVLTIVTSKKVGVFSNDKLPDENSVQTVQLPPIEDHSYNSALPAYSAADVEEAKAAMELDRGRRSNRDS